MAESELSEARRDATGERRLTIGAVCSALKEDFPDISISKIRYLEDQKLLAPRRTRGGYRLYSVEDVERLRRILKLQRDEFLPLRVIREELDRPERDDTGPASRRRRAAGAPPLTGRAPDARRAERRSPARRPSWCASSRTSRCSRRATAATGPRTPRSPRWPRRSAATASAPATCARSTRRSSARRGCSSSCSRRRCGPGTPSGGRPASRRPRRSRRCAPSSPS